MRSVSGAHRLYPRLAGPERGALHLLADLLARALDPLLRGELLHVPMPVGLLPELTRPCPLTAVPGTDPCLQGTALWLHIDPLSLVYPVAVLGKRFATAFKEA